VTLRNFARSLRISLPILLATLARAATIPTPESHFGHPIGVDRVLLDWSDVVSYFHKLANASRAIKIEEVGKTAEGRPFLAAIISSPENLRNLPKYLEIQRRLADPRLTTPAQAEELIPQAKAVIFITCSVHATEVASTHTAVQFAYKLLTDNSPKYATIRKNTIVVLMPSINPDGVDIVTRWYKKTLNTPFEGTAPPELYHHYVGHDNNRDWYTFSQPETRNVITTYNRFLPEILYDVHQQGEKDSRIFVPPWLDPIEPNIDPIIAQGMNALGLTVANDLTAAGKTGVAVHAAYDFWSPARHYQAFHGGKRILTESASAHLATPVTLKFTELNTHPLGYNAQQRSWNYLEPWPGGTWHLSDIINYQMVAFESVLYNATLHREDLARDYYKIGQRQSAREAPCAWVIPAEQRDPGATRHMLEILAFGKVEIKRAANGDHVVLMQQPYSGWAKALLERQDYPNLRVYPGGPPQRPYDTTAETLPLLFGVEAKAVTTPISGPLADEQFPFDAPTPAAFAASDTDSWKTVAHLWQEHKPVWRNETTGDFAVSDKGAGWKQLSAPRIALYRSYLPAMDEGWTRWLLEDFGFAYKDVSNAELQAGHLKDNYDVLIFPDQPVASIVDGFAKGKMPEEFTGGIGDNGIEAVKEFAHRGGTVLCLNHSSNFCIDKLGVPATNVLSNRVAAAAGDESRGGPGPSSAPTTRESRANRNEAASFYSPGSLLNVTLDLHSPLTFGLPQSIAVWNEQSPAFTTTAQAVATYPESGILASGWLLGSELIAQKTAIVNAPIGEGRIILFGLRPQYRAQSYQAFKLFFNALVAYSHPGEDQLTQAHNSD
jgi:Zinc carboxypeptidase